MASNFWLVVTNPRIGQSYYVTDKSERPNFKVFDLSKINLSLHLISRFILWRMRENDFRYDLRWFRCFAFKSNQILHKQKTPQLSCSAGEKFTFACKHVQSVGLVCCYTSRLVSMSSYEISFEKPVVLLCSFCWASIEKESGKFSENSVDLGR